MADSEIATPNQNAAADGDTEIDLYADFVENELDTEGDIDYGTNDGQDQHLQPEGDLYDDVITAQSSASDFIDITNAIRTNAKNEQSNGLTSYPNSSPIANGGKRISLYVAQLTWWTTDTNLADAIRELGINDLLEVKFHENRVNGQSKGFAVVTVGSDGSSRTITEKLPKKEIHGQAPRILPCNKQSLSYLEGPTHKDVPMEAMPGMNVPSIRPMMHVPNGLSLPLPRPGHIEGPYGYPPPGSVILPGGSTGIPRLPMQMSLGPRSHVAGAPLVLGRIPGPPVPGGVHAPPSLIVMQQTQRPVLPPGTNGSHYLRPSIRPNAPGIPVSSSSMTTIPGQHPPGYYPSGQPATSHGASAHSLSMSGQTHPDSFYHTLDGQANVVSISETEFQEIMERNKNVSSSAIARAVQDASTGEFGTAIETLVTAISLIKQSKISHDDRCKILISSLQDTLKGIEDKSYGQKVRHRSRSGSPRESRRKNRHRSRSPRERNDHRRSEDYDGKYSRDHRRR